MAKITVESIRKIVMMLNDVSEAPHFERIAFKTNKKIFATLSEKDDLCCVMLDPKEQSVFCSFKKEVIFPVPNKWGDKGATYINLKKVPVSILKDALTVAHELKSKKK